MITPSVCNVDSALNCSVNDGGASVRIVATHVQGLSSLYLGCIGLKDPRTLSKIAGLHLAISAKPNLVHPGCNSVFVGVVSESAIAALLGVVIMQLKAAPLFEHVHGCAAPSSFSCFFITHPSQTSASCFFQDTSPRMTTKFAPHLIAPTLCFNLKSSQATMTTFSSR